jgi:hypothetical protein
MALESTGRPPTACRHTVSGTISLPIKGYFSPFPHGTSSLSVTTEYLALEGGPPRFLQNFTCSAVLGDKVKEVYEFSPTGLSPSMAGRSRAVRLTRRFVTPRRSCNLTRLAPQPQLCNACRLTHNRFRLFPVRSPLLRKSRLLSVPRVT